MKRWPDSSGSGRPGRTVRPSIRAGGAREQQRPQADVVHAGGTCQAASSMRALAARQRTTSRPTVKPMPCPLSAAPHPPLRSALVVLPRSRWSDSNCAPLWPGPRQCTKASRRVCAGRPEIGLGWREGQDYSGCLQTDYLSFLVSVTREVTIGGFRRSLPCIVRPG